jgi:threonine/homoserine/homoserine lactone efflux protein
MFAGAVLVLNATPGVDFLLTVSRTLQGGARAGIAAVLGINAGCVVHTLVAASGLAALLALHPQALQTVQWAGAAYLLWLGTGLLRQAWRPDPAAAPPATDGPARRPGWADFRAGLLTNVLNPKVALFFLAFLPQFVPARTPSAATSFLLLGTWMVVQSTVFLLALVAIAARLSRLQAPDAARRWLNGLGGLLFIGLALRLLRARPVLA